MKEASEFRSKAEYNNVMYSLVGHLAEKLEGKDYRELLAKQLLHPLSMRHTTFQGHIGRHESNLASQYGYNMQKRRFRLSKERYG